LLTCGICWVDEPRPARDLASVPRSAIGDRSAIARRSVTSSWLSPVAVARVDTLLFGYKD